MASKASLARAALRDAALAYPGAHEDFPWGECVVKVRKKVFVFLGREGEGLSVSAKLPVSGPAALTLPFASPTGYGLGRGGWVTATFGESDRPPLDILREWLHESYHAIAPKSLAVGGEALSPATPPKAVKRATATRVAKRATPKRGAKRATPKKEAKRSPPKKAAKRRKR